MFLTLLSITISALPVQSREIIMRAGDPTIRSLVMQRRPGFAGVLPYIRDKQGATYVLLGRETLGKDRGKYCGMGGLNEFDRKTNRYACLLSTALKELQEETANQLTLDEDYLLQNAIFHGDFSNKDFLKIMALTPLFPKHYRTSHHLYKARESIQVNYSDVVYHGGLPCDLWPYLEKDDFQWVSIGSLLSSIINPEADNLKVVSLNKTLQNPHELDTRLLTTEITISLRTVFLKTLRGLRGSLREFE